MPEQSGVVVVDKPPGWTSHDVVGRCRRLAGTRRVGHAGTLDPMATGVLLLGVGRATRLLGYLTSTDKAYDATIRLGQSTVTDDADGEVVAEQDASGVDDAALDDAMRALTGDLQQVPCAVSAIKVKGERAYKRARTGEGVDLPPRPVTVSEFTAHDVRRAGRAVLDVDVHVECSTGTYVRALARDLGAALGVGGHLTALRRTRVGPYRVADAVTMESLEQQWQVQPLDDVVPQVFPTYTVADALVAGVRNGRAFTARLGHDGPVAVVSPAGEFLALYEQHGPVAKPVAVFAPG